MLNLQKIGIDIFGWIVSITNNTIFYFRLEEDMLPSAVSAFIIYSSSFKVISISPH